jgi:hypothetical protein
METILIVVLIVFLLGVFARPFEALSAQSGVTF